jgi:hypothetical protein
MSKCKYCGRVPNDAGAIDHASTCETLGQPLKIVKSVTYCGKCGQVKRQGHECQLKHCITCDVFNENDRLREQLKAKDEALLDVARGQMQHPSIEAFARHAIWQAGQALKGAPCQKEE